MRSNTEIARSLLCDTDLEQYAEKGRVYLDCPYAEKDRVKALGAIWDRAQRKWYIESWADQSPFKRWIKPKKKPAPTPTGLYLVSKKKNSAAHIWTGNDTACRLFSTGGMGKKRKDVSTHTYGKRVCHMCQSVMSRDDPPKNPKEEYQDDVDNYFVRLVNL